MRQPTGDDAVSLTARDAARVGRAARFAEGADLGAYNRSAAPGYRPDAAGAAVWAVEVTGVAGVAGAGTGQTPPGLCPGTVEAPQYDPDFRTTNWVVLGDGTADAWVIDDPAAPFAGTGGERPVCLLVDDYEGRPVFAPSGSAARSGGPLDVEVVSGSDPVYVLKRKKLLLGAWVDATVPPPPPPPPGVPPPPPAPPDPLPTITAYRQKSNVGGADVAPGQMGIAWLSPGTGPAGGGVKVYEFLPWGSVNRAILPFERIVDVRCVTLANGSRKIQVTKVLEKKRLYAREICVAEGSLTDT